jgi:DNA-binding transcriptional LysR family regulator
MRDTPTGAAPHRDLAFDSLSHLRVFAAVVETMSFSSAAQRLSMMPSTVSKQISDLEATLGVLLVNRTTRTLLITDAGRMFYQRCLNILDEIGQAQSELEEGTSEPKGLVRVTAPGVFAQRHIAAHLPEFLARYPAIRVDMILTTQLLDMVREGIDVAIRITAHPDDNLVAIRLADNERTFVASPAYLEKHGTPQSPAQLNEHNCLLSRQEGRGAPWSVKVGTEVQSLHLSGNLIADNGEILLEAALQGGGIAMLPAFLTAPYIRSGRLVSILQAHAVDPTAIYAMLARRKYVAKRTRCFIDFMKELLAQPRWKI